MANHPPFRVPATHWRGRQSGQAAVEAALTLPLTVFLVFGTLQLFMMEQGRIMAQVAAYRAVRAGSVNQGHCTPMMHSAIATLLPTITRTNDAASLAAAFGLRSGNKYFAATNGNVYQGPIVEIVRESPTPAQVPAVEDKFFDAPLAAPQPPMRLRIRMVFWEYLRIPFVNWVMSKMFMAHFGLQTYLRANPLLVADRNANWPGTDVQGTLSAESWPGGQLAAHLQSSASAGHYLFPIRVTAEMRMMTPAKKSNFGAAACPLTPQ